MTTLHVEGVTVSFGALVALSDVSFTVEPGTVHAIIGPNGAGKSTLLNVLSGLYRPTAGRVRYDGHELTTLAPHRIARLGIARSFQNVALSGGQTVRDSLLLGRHWRTTAGAWRTALRTPQARREERQQHHLVEGIAARFGLLSHMDRPVAELAYGDRKRVDLARAMCAEPSLLLLDEPVAGLNATEGATVAGLIRQIRAEHGATIVLIEHDMPMVMALADQITVLDFGRLVAQGPPDEVQSDPAVLRAYLGVA